MFKFFLSILTVALITSYGSSVAFSADQELVPTVRTEKAATETEQKKAAQKNTEQKSAEQKNREQLSRSPVEDEVAIKALLSSLLEAANQHKIDELLKYYSPHFTSGDSLNLKEIKSLVETTWKSFPDVQYRSNVLDLRINGSWATVESLDQSAGSAKVDPLVSATPGKMSSQSRAILYLHKVGKRWEIVSDATLYEKAFIVYGPFETVKIDVQTPEQVFAGDDYTAKMMVDIPEGTIAFASLSQEPLTHPHQSGKDKFRTLSEQNRDLERIFNANKTHNNEVVTATVGFTQIAQDNQDRPVIQFKGVITVVKRVNVISKSAYKPGDNNSPLVHHSADGKIHYSADMPVEETEEDDPMPQHSMIKTTP
jgi:hypothetical protein